MAESMLPTTEATTDTQPADEAIRALIDQQTEAWNRNDAVAWTKDFAEDANFINIRGDLVKGRTAIEKIHAFIFSGPYKESHCAVKIESIRYPAPNVAVVDTTSEVTNFKGLPPGVSATEPGILRTRPKFILVSEKGAWKIVAVHNTAISPQRMTVE
jgi:uncharacterized protein (TIGR02246 family)